LNNNEDFIDYQLWVDEGWLIVHEGNVIDHDIVSAKALEYMKTVNVKGIGFDVRHAYGGVITTIAKNGYEDICSPTAQGFKLSPAVITTEAALEKKKYNFFNNPVTAWNFSNVVMKIGEQGDYFPDKSKGANKIDIISALLTAETERNHREQGKTKVDVGIRILN
jgi:phage terminase large subunit-like protein